MNANRRTGVISLRGVGRMLGYTKSEVALSGYAVIDWCGVTCLHGRRIVRLDCVMNGRPPAGCVISKVEQQGYSICCLQNYPPFLFLCLNDKMESIHAICAQMIGCSWLTSCVTCAPKHVSSFCNVLFICFDLVCI